ncbi:dihydrolipoyllysine-residue succinyltransferase [Candidatus Pseudomonas adelgestsugas]|uniref:Dihydrolipoyllysine-residue succinyltransferase component of 2-oxoglutarate dehydrogenase complex n=1 Tax=Candidatus Pseudomonas adelgestsugas TaxID=1302376 RepID=A0ABX5R8L0_9PSED|nr:dihydrolipoyllysine-residue succinyltransferase [Candidatus Pseudomonas adelgestsugas]QAX81985.1 Dihydrolipoyllysine-residue succinyltransferase component of 2-oxoglutarate dehydrogenase complex [Candidatus Pseudomonas adelgestsugas]
MAIEINAPLFPESVADGTVATWHKKLGDTVKRDDLIVDIETDKVVLEVLAEADGILAAIFVEENATVLSNQVLGSIETGSAVPVADIVPVTDSEGLIAAPAARQLAEENGIKLSSIEGTGKGGRVTKEDVVAVVKTKSNALAAAMPVFAVGQRTERRVPMTRIRATVAKRLIEAQSNMAMLTTFNEVDMTSVITLRSKYKDLFIKSHNGVRLGFMSFFVKAATVALQRFSVMNAFIDGNDIVYHGYVDVGVAVSNDRGLVVPVLRNAELMSLAEIESSIAGLGKKARNGTLTIDEITGGTFTITNGGIFGSMMSTPIINPPQAAILGMHTIIQRPIAINSQVLIRPMMYLALSYDHRLIDGKDAVTFLVLIKNLLEDPARLLLDI